MIIAIPESINGFIRPSLVSQPHPPPMGHPIIHPREKEKFADNFEIQAIEIIANSEGILDFTIRFPLFYVCSEGEHGKGYSASLVWLNYASVIPKSCLNHP